jgi:hypothetical protein
MTQNKRIRYLGREYEIFWTTQHARHICSSYHADKLHDIHHEDIAQLLEYYDAVDPERNDRYTFLNWNNQRRCVYEIHVYLVNGGRNRPGRCVVLTGYRTNKQQYLAAAAAAQQQR